tara:strand:+ start:774 stop:923 length:150 start_codon:yes stop_codon:yes gene_type:complete
MTNEQYELHLTAFQGRLAMAKLYHLATRDVYKAMRDITLAKLKCEVGHE